MNDTLLDLEAIANDGSVFRFKELQGKVVLIVNTASKCGFTPQYEGLEKLHRGLGARGLMVVGFPCDQFAHQEPGSDADIQSFCSRNFGVSFPLMKKVEVNGKGTHPVFAWLRSRTPGSLFGNRIKWNFTKFLVGKDGRTVKRYAPTVEPAALVADIEAMLNG